MNFGRIAIAEAHGALLAHTHRIDGHVFHKGTPLDAATLDCLRNAGCREVVAAMLGPDDVAEDVAAARLAALLVGTNLVASPPAAGRVNLHATAHGLFRADKARVDALNSVNEGITLATLPDAVTVSPREMVATIKIIPFAIGAGCLGAAEAVPALRTALRVAAFRPLVVGLILTRTGGMKESVLGSTRAVTADRIAAFGGTMLPVLRCAHDAAALGETLAKLAESGPDLMLVAVASATMDRADVGPAAIRRAGGAVVHFGMPVDPGNLLCLGRIGDVPVMVLPGCARSPALNGIDLCLRRLFAGETLGSHELSGMGIGGLLKTFVAHRG